LGSASGPWSVARSRHQPSLSLRRRLRLTPLRPRLTLRRLRLIRQPMRRQHGARAGTAIVGTVTGPTSTQIPDITWLQMAAGISAVRRRYLVPNFWGVTCFRPATCTLDSIFSRRLLNRIARLWSSSSRGSQPPIDQPPPRAGWIHEVKHDGYPHHPNHRAPSVLLRCAATCSIAIRTRYRVTQLM
jgi:hypothetical protein